MNRTVIAFILVVPLLVSAQASDEPTLQSPLISQPERQDDFRLLDKAPLEAPQAGYREVTRPRLALVIAGAAAFEVTHGLTAVLGLTSGAVHSVVGGSCGRSLSCSEAAWFGFVPVAGPILLTNANLLPIGVGVVLTAAQTLGILTFASGFIFPKHAWVIDRRNQPPLAVSMTANGIEVRF